MITRLDSVSCAICMESLFCKTDDLDELCQIATPDCGHVFHEDCIRQWFKTQSMAHLAAHREARGRSISPSSEISDGPNECPTCRTECYADEDTGEPTLHRLFINFEGSGWAGGSSQAGSSPMRPVKKERVKADEEVMGLARRAKDIGQDVKRVDGAVDDVGGREVEGLLERAGGIERDLISQKAIDGVKKYVGGLTAAMNSLRTTVATHPLTADLRIDLVAAQGRHAELTAKNADLQKQLKDLVAVHLPQEIASAVKKEQRKCAKEVEKVRADMEVIKGQLDKEAVLRATARREMEERLKAQEKKTSEALLLAMKEKSQRESINATLNERNRQLKAYQAKAESRKVIKTELEDLKAENARLHDQIRASTSAPRRSAADPSLQNLFDDVIEGSDEEDEAIQDDASPSRARQPRQSVADESLIVELPSFAMSTHVSGGRNSKAHPTARTFPSDQFASSSPKPKKRPPPPRESKYWMSGPSATASGLVSGSRSRTNYLSESEDEQDAAVDEEPSPAKKSRTNPFSSTRAETERKKTLAPGKPVVARPASNGSSSKAPATRRETIVVGSSSPEPREPLRSAKPNGSGPGSLVAARSGIGAKKTVLGKQPSIIDVLGLADKNGRPVKGLASGAKVKRKA